MIIFKARIQCPTSLKVITINIVMVTMTRNLIMNTTMRNFVMVTTMRNLTIVAMRKVISKTGIKIPKSNKNTQIAV